MRQNYCDRCGRPIKDPNAKYGWRCAEIVAAGGSLTVDLSAILTMLEKYADFSFDAQRDLFEVFGIFNKMLTFASSPSLLQEEEDYVEKGAGLAYAMFSNYESLNTDEKKSAVSHFISEMQMADETLPLPITKPSFSERVNMELQNYYAAKNNPNTNDTVEDSIDAFFGNIPLYNYLNAIFAPTERERKRNLIRGIESSLRAIENLPYTSSMMGDISIVHPYPAVAPDIQPYADTTPEPYPPAADSAGNTTVYSANGDPALRITRRPAFDDMKNNGINVKGRSYKLNDHAYNSLFKSGRKDIMPTDINDALKTNPVPAKPGSVCYTNPITGTRVFVNSSTNEIVGIWPADFIQ